MALYMETGTIVRALPTDEGLGIKLQRADGGSIELDVPSDRPDLVAAARTARMEGTSVTLRRTGAGMVVALTAGGTAAAA